MGNKIACRICGGRIVLDPSGENGSCENCGLVYEGETLRAMIGVQKAASGEPSQVRVDGPISKADEPAPTPSVGSEARPPEGSALPVVAKRQEPGSTVEVAPQDHSASTAEQEPSVLRRWKTSWGFSVFGALTFGVLSVIAGKAITDMVALCWVNAIWLALVAVYAACIYPSFFSEGSMLGDSPKVISFFNFFFGGVIFGSLWNASLTNKKKGVSRVVCIVLALLLSGYFGTMGVTAANATPYDSINEPGWTYSDKTGWSSDLVYSSAGGEDAQYWDVFNNNACWVLCEFAEIDYDAAHEYWCEVADVESWDVKLTRGEAEDLARVPIWGQYKAIPETRWATSKCKFETPHARVYAADFWVGNQGYTMRMAHCFFHESDEQPLLNHGGEYAPWIITIGEIEE